MKVSLVMPTHNKLPRLMLTLASLSRQSLPTTDWELVLVDDGSSDGTAEYLASFDAPMQMHRLSGPQGGRSSSRNRGLAHAQYDLVVFADDDMITPPEFLAEHVKAQVRGPRVVHGRIVNMTALKFFHDPSAGVFYPSTIPRTGSASSLREECISLNDVQSEFDRKVRRHRHITAIESVIEQILTGQAPGPNWIGFTGGNVGAPREWLLESGGFDAEFGTDWGSEDLELGYRLHRQGRPFFYSYEAVAYHMAHHRFDFDTEQLRTSERFLNKHVDEEIALVTRFISGELDSHSVLRAFQERAERAHLLGAQA